MIVPRTIAAATYDVGLPGACSHLQLESNLRAIPFVYITTEFVVYLNADIAYLP
jgi:hypothetical protein